MLIFIAYVSFANLVLTAFLYKMVLDNLDDDRW